MVQKTSIFVLVDVKVGVKCSIQIEILLSHEAILSGLNGWVKSFYFTKSYFLFDT